MSAAASPARFPHLCILASAGSGKTFRLTNRYLALVAANAPVGSILASTFTRAAAGEIRNRILMRLAGAADDEAKQKELADFIDAGHLGRTDVLALLRTVTSNMHRLQIRTLDSFFASVVRAFALELGIPLEADVTDAAGAESLRHEAIRRMLDEREPQRMIDLLRLLTQGGSDRSVMQAIDEVVTGLHSLYRQSPAEAWEPLAAMPALSAPKTVEAIQRVEQCALPDKKSLIKAKASDLEKARAHRWEDLLSAGLAGKIASGADSYGQTAIPEDVLAAYQPLVSHARAVINNHLRDQTIATRDLLAMFDSQYAAARQRRGLMTFDDITDAMAGARSLGGFEEICFRIDAQIQHLLLDEFQDTSIPQWRALGPIAAEIVSDISRPRSFFCVGDAKQSIYGWREAAPEILDEIPNLLAGPEGESVIRLETLARSWRSSPPVIDAVNIVFEKLAGNEAVDEFREAIEAFSASFEHHDTNEQDLPGYVELRTARRAEEDESKDALRLREAAELAQSLHEQAPDRTIALLTRTNKAAARLLFEFSPGQLDIPASGRGGSALTDAPAVESILDLLTLADHPDDTIAAFNVAHGPLGLVLGFTDEQHAARRRALSRLLRRHLLDHGYAAAIAGWAAALAPACDERQYRRVLQLIELAGRHDENPTLRSGDFIRAAQERMAAAHKPAPVQVMTVHQAKGLEFDVVILADMEGNLAGNGNPPVVYERRGPTGPVRRICRYVRKEVRELLPSVKPMFDLHRMRTVRDSLSVLYVAMTRARHALYMLIDPPSIRKSGEVSSTIPKTAAGVVRCAMWAGDEPPEPGEVLFRCGDENWISRTAPTPAKEVAAALEVLDGIHLAEPRGLIARGITADAASALHGSAESEGPDRQIFRMPDQAALDRGTAIHKLFEQIEWLDDFQADEQELVRLVKRTVPRRGEDWARQQAEAFGKMLEQREIRRALSQNGDSPAMSRVFRELPFARLVDGRVQMGFIDRLTVEFDEHGRPRAATIIDFKTDAIGADEAEAAAEGYRRQIETYRDAVARSYGLPGTAISMRLLFVTAGREVSLT